MTAHLYPTCAACLAPLDSDRHDAECVAPLVVLCGESPAIAGESGSVERQIGGCACDNGHAKQSGPKRCVNTMCSGPNRSDTLEEVIG